MDSSVPTGIVRFADFELDHGRYQLRHAGRVLKLEKIPMDLLLLLVEAQGRVVTREQIVQRIWGKEVFLDTEHGINTAIRKIRLALHDDPDSPRFVETVTGRGYRFVFPVESPASPPQISPPPPQAQQVPARAYHPRLLWLLAVVAVCLAAAATLSLNAGGVRDRLFPAARASQIRSIAVLPFSNLSGDPAEDYFADGLTDETITMLAKNSSLRVVSRTSVTRYKGVSRPLRDIASELGVDGILEGSVNRTPNHLHMTVQLIYAPTDSHVWADSYDRDPAQALSLPAELSQTIAALVRVPRQPLARTRLIKPEAHDAYLHGRYFWLKGNDDRAQEFYEKAIQLQPDYAAAWSGLSDSYAERGMDSRPSREVAQQVESTARKGVELDDNLAETHHSMAAWYFFYSWDLPHAELESRHAIGLNPTFSEGHHLRSYILLAMNRPDEALQEQKRATELDPFVRPTTLGRAYLHLRRFDEALSDLRLRAEGLPTSPAIRFYLSVAYWHKGMWKESAEELEKALQLEEDGAAAQAVHQAFARGGHQAVDQWRVDTIQARARKRYVAAFEIATQYAYLGDKKKTLDYLEASYRAHDPWLIMVQTEPVFDSLHHEPRYQALVREIGLPTIN